ncbi:MAG: hypothetical protein O2931_10600 [Planctomycetota bacterium]|nr:hypothetical protein [Planctomycetota bacterium]
MLVEEVDGPNDGTDVSWLLITSLPIDSFKDIQLVIVYYVANPKNDSLLHPWMAFGPGT